MSRGGLEGRCARISISPTPRCAFRRPLYTRNPIRTSHPALNEDVLTPQRQGYVNIYTVDVNTSCASEEGAHSPSGPNGLIVVITIIPDHGVTPSGAVPTYQKPHIDRTRLSPPSSDNPTHIIRTPIMITLSGDIWSSVLISPHCGNPPSGNNLPHQDPRTD